MSNERLRAAITTAGLNLEDFSGRVGVDPKTVERWITKGRLPHRTHRMRAGAVLAKSDSYLWPQTESDPRSRSATQAELVHLYPSRRSIPPQMWADLLDQATDSIDLLAFSASFLHDSVPGFVERLIDRATDGVRVRVLFGDPDSQAVALRGREEGIDGLMASRCELTWRYLTPALNTGELQARQHGRTLYASIFRFDDVLLANPHTYGCPAGQAPVLHLNRIAGGRMFTHYMESFERVWESATPR